MLRNRFSNIVFMLAALVSTSAAFAYEDGLDRINEPRPTPTFGQQWWDVAPNQTPQNPQHMRAKRETDEKKSRDNARSNERTSLSSCHDMQRNARALRDAQRDGTKRYTRCLEASADSALDDDCSHEFDALQDAQYDAEKARRDWRRSCE